MAISWLAVLQSVPWSDVIKNAPKVAEGAKNLFDTVARRGRKAETPTDTAADGGTPTGAPQSAEAHAIAALEVRVARLDAAVADLNAQLLASSQVIKDLAEQNTQLIQRIEANRVRTLWLAGASGLALVLLAGLMLLMGR
jgi:hypothetical protein